MTGFSSTIKVIVGAAMLAAAALSARADGASTKLDALIAGPQRSEQNRVRDPYRHLALIEPG